MGVPRVQKQLPSRVPVPADAGMGFRGYGYGYSQKYPQVTCDVHYHLLLFQMISTIPTCSIVTAPHYSVIPYIHIHPLYLKNFSGDALVPQDSLVSTNQFLSAPTHSSLPPFNHILPPNRTVFDYLLEGQESQEIGGCCKFDYITVMTQSPLHCGAGQQTPAWIITQMEMEGEGKMSEGAKLGPGIAVRIFDQELSRKTFGFERV